MHPSRDASERPKGSVLVIGDVRLYREGLALALSARGFLSVAGAETPVDSLSKARELRPAIAIVDVTSRGADGYVTVDATLDDLERAIAHIGQEELLCSPRIAATLFRCLAHGNGRVAEAAADNMLTPREREIWKCIGGGLSNKEIAGALNISVLTVKNHVHHLLRKLNVSTRSQAASRLSLPSRRAPSSRQAWNKP